MQLEGLVGLAEHEHVVGDVAAQPVPPDLVGAVGVVVDGVEELAGVGAPGAPVVAARHLVGQVLAGAQVAEAQPVDLVAGGVDGVGQQPLVGADQGQPELEVAAAGVEGADVEDDLVVDRRSAAEYIGKILICDGFRLTI